MNASGSFTDATVAAVLRGAVDGRAGARLRAADMGNEASIALLLGVAAKTARFEDRVQVNGTPVGARTQGGILRQCSQRLEDFHHRLRRFQSARIHFER
jgi:N-acetylglucosamine kinase-like BadF-type ATPase